MAAPADDILREFLDSSSDFFFRLRLTPDRAFEFASAAAPLFTGYSPGELRARPELAASFLHPASLPDFEEALRSPAPSTLDVRFLHADGHAVPASLHVVPANGSGGGACVSGLARLTGAAGSFFPVVEALTEAACVMAGERIVYANPACARLTGRSVEELLTFPSLYGLLDPGERAAAAERHGKRLPGEAVEGPCRFRLQRTDGSAFWAQFESFPTSWNGRPATLVLARDVTQVKEWEDRWRVQSLVLDQMQDRVAVAGLDGRLTYVNDALCRSLARPREELLGQPVEILGDDPARGPSQRAILQHVLEHGEWYGDLTNRAADGTERPVECRVTLVRDENGQPAAIFGVATDLTAQRRAEAEIRGRDARYRAAIESSLDGFVMTGLDGRILEVNTGLLHSSDLDPHKAVNWKRMAQFNGRYGVLGDLGMHACHVPFRAGWQPLNVRALLSNVFPQRPDGRGGWAPCDTWDNATLLVETRDPSGGETFPWTCKLQRIAPGQKNTWYLEVLGTRASARFSTRNPLRLQYLDYRGGEQDWVEVQCGHEAAFPTITGAIFEFGFGDAILQMWAAFLNELHHGPPARRFVACVTPDEAALSHRLFTAALQSQDTGQTVAV